MSLEWDKLYKLGTDVAAFVFFYPKRLEHRKEDAINSWGTSFKEEFLARRLESISVLDVRTRTDLNNC